MNPQVSLSRNRQISAVLEQVAESLDVPDEVHEEAERKYKHVGNFLEEQDRLAGRRAPHIYPQGSFRLGTVVRPMNLGAYDIDLVYKRDLLRTSTTQEQLKDEAGELLKRYVKQCEKLRLTVPTLQPGRRCWTLDYENNFHMDVLPAIPDDESPVRPEVFSADRILITDRELHAWQHSNPIGYSEWFKTRMATQFREKRAFLAESLLKASADDVPEYKVKTPLQRAIQVLKRHRDVQYENDDVDKPISIIITTLAAKSYDNEPDLVDTMLKLVRVMPGHIEERNVNGKRVAWVSNPVNASENFADKWEEFPQREQRFREWLRKVEDDLTAALSAGNIFDLIDVLGGSLGNATVTKAAAARGLTEAVSSPTAFASPAVPAIGTTSHRRVVPWLRVLDRSASIVATAHRHKYDTEQLFALTNRPVSKGLYLRFEVATDAQGPYEVHWQVVNTGDEARRANGLRGGFDDDPDGHGPVRWECTEYAGTHWIEAFIVRRDACIARTGRYFVRISK